MAKILLGSTIADIRGKQGGTVYSKNRYANYTRNKTIPVNPNTTKQSAIRSIMGSIASTWRSLTEDDRIKWGLLASALQATNVFGQSFTYSGFNVYQRSNMNNAQITGDLSEFRAQPGSTSAPTFADITPTVLADASDGSIDVSFVFTEGVTSNPALPLQTALQLQATEPVQAGLSETTVAKRFRNIQSFPGGTDFTTPADIITNYAATFGTITGDAGNQIWFRVRLIDLNTGIASPWLVFFQEIQA